MSSTMRSNTVCSLLAPMLSTDVFTCDKKVQALQVDAVNK